MGALLLQLCDFIVFSRQLGPKCMCIFSPVVCTAIPATADANDAAAAAAAATAAAGCHTIGASECRQRAQNSPFTLAGVPQSRWKEVLLQHHHTNHNLGVPKRSRVTCAGT